MATTNKQPEAECVVCGATGHHVAGKAFRLVDVNVTEKDDDTLLDKITICVKCLENALPVACGR